MLVTCCHPKSGSGGDGGAARGCHVAHEALIGAAPTGALGPALEGPQHQEGPPPTPLGSGGSARASPAEIRAAFLARCKEVHPDGDPSDPSRHGRFLLLAEAYAALSAPRARTPPRDPPRGQPGTPPPPRAAPRPGTPPRWDENRRYWEQFQPPRTPHRTPPRQILGLLLLLVSPEGGSPTACLQVRGRSSHAAFLDKQEPGAAARSTRGPGAGRGHTRRF
ncbi:dnaJ homolog subfamily C member 4 [Corvus moneduloides]|uniref:dnaJ homolog subfamily C member 4 n=1 Tax=Corvus moneduloides TaxID=1196302 RepID=UPI00136314D8|nr:dnaJ homolog subfamily C member 4 [Corvus moneduloides]